MEGSDYFIKRGGKTLLVYVLILAGLGGLFRLIPTGFLPEEDMGAILTNIIMPDGTSLAKTSELSKEIEEQLMELPGIRQIGGIIGMNGDNTALIFTVFQSLKKERALQN